MTDAELERLATLIADAIEAALDRRDRDGGRSSSRDAVNGAPWLPTPVRPEPPARGGDPAVWTGAAQSLGDVAPGGTAPPRHRVTTAELTAATRSAAAGRAPARDRPAPDRAPPTGRRRGAALPISVPVGISNRHVHLSAADARALFGTAPFSVARQLKQPGQFAANETVAVEGPSGRIEGVRVVAPARGATQLELARSDAARLGVDPPLAASGSLEGSAGGVTLVGPNGRVPLSHGVIVAARHLHLAPNDAGRWGLRDGDRVDVRCGDGARATTFHDVLVRSGPAHATELHLDADEARAAAVTGGQLAEIIARREGVPARRRLVTERDVIALARAGQPIPKGAILTPSARDRARTLGLTTA